ncbi:MAG: hypothetical protein MUO76_00510, partial [Anaerolineaceae bacterium]|nr:hypothetical protein [Anaerolineaceae bacterium]
LNCMRDFHGMVDFIDFPICLFTPQFPQSGFVGQMSISAIFGGYGNPPSRIIFVKIPKNIDLTMNFGR